METDKLLEFLNTLYPISHSLEAGIRGRVIKGEFKKGQILVSPGRRADEIWYIAKGLAKEYYYDPSGKVVITAFWKENELMLIADSFFGKKHPERYIELIEDCTLLTIDSKQAHQLHDLYPEIRSFGYSILTAAKRKDNERSALLVLNAKESNQQFCETFPWGRISVTDAASYLGLIRTTLSTIRSQVLKSKS